MNKNFYCVILAGGIGMRLWPASREKKPKQFLDIMNTGETMLQATYRRFQRIIDKDNIIVVANSNFKDLVREQLPELAEQNILLEPMRRNTVTSVTWAALEVLRRNRDGAMVVSPADQMITDEDKFEQDILHGLDYACNNARLLTLGAVPTHPDTAFGYIQMADKVDDNIYNVRSFTEKPEKGFADMFFESGEFLWNTGLFVWGAATFLHAIHDKNQEFVAFLSDVIKNYQGNVITGSQLEDIYSKVPNMNLEQGVLEKADNVDVMQCHFGWKDIGNWKAVHNQSKKDDEGNVVIDSKSLLYDCKNCVVKLPNGHIAVLQGLEDYMVVEDGNVLVICKKDDQKSIRKFVNDAQLEFGEEFV
ncbi:MAG: mannose-1-phosphate guanylyltransferase [Bacteroidaceae bacterium]|nr:mannose-1-phosphate guanylyltransferase [Bacteroidaceae bacterium]